MRINNLFYLISWKGKKIWNFNFVNWYSIISKGAFACKYMQKYAPKANPRPLFSLVKPKAAITCKEFFYKSDILKEDYQKGFKKLTLFFIRNSCHLCVTRMYVYFVRMSLVCTRMSFLCHSYVLECRSYVTCMYSYVIRMSFVCTLMLSVCNSYVFVCHSYVTRM